MVLPWNIFFCNFPSLVILNSLGIGQGGLYIFSLSIARFDITNIPCCASPPRTFCQENVTTSNFFQGKLIASTAEVASHKVNPSLVSGIQLPLGTLTPEVVPFQVKTTSFSKLIFFTFPLQQMILCIHEGWIFLWQIQSYKKWDKYYFIQKILHLQ